MKQYYMRESGTRQYEAQDREFPAVETTVAELARTWLRSEDIVTFEGTPLYWPDHRTGERIVNFMQNCAINADGSLHTTNRPIDLEWAEVRVDATIESKYVVLNFDASGPASGIQRLTDLMHLLICRQGVWEYRSWAGGAYNPEPVWINNVEYPGDLLMGVAGQPGSITPTGKHLLSTTYDHHGNENYNKIRLGIWGNFDTYDANNPLPTNNDTRIPVQDIYELILLHTLPSPAQHQQILTYINSLHSLW